MLLRIRKATWLCGFGLEEHPGKSLGQWKKVLLNWKQNLYICVGESEKN